MKNFINEEWSKMREMTFTEKRQYIWEYYKLHFIGALLAGVFIFNLLNIWILNPNREYYVYIAWLGNPIPFEYLQGLSYSLEEIVDNPDRQLVQVTSYTASPLPAETMAIQTRFIAMMQLQELDIFLTSHDGIYDVAAEGFIQPIHEVMSYLAQLNPTLHAELTAGERLRTITYQHSFPDNAGERPYIMDVMAVSVVGSRHLEAVGIDASDLYMSVISNTRRPAQIAEVLEVLLR